MRRMWHTRRHDEEVALVVGSMRSRDVGVASAARARRPGRARGQPGAAPDKDLQPLAVRGAGFVPTSASASSRQRAAACMRRRKSQTLPACSAMKFSISAGPCRGYYAIRAYGSRGSRARRVSQFPQRECTGPGHALAGRRRHERGVPCATAPIALSHAEAESVGKSEGRFRGPHSFVASDGRLRLVVLLLVLPARGRPRSCC